MGARPLDGYRVIDFTHAAAGPFATRWLADLGAEVIKIEKPGRGDGVRYMGEPMRGPKDSDYYVALNADKKSVSLDLSNPEAVEVARRLVAEGDMVVSNFRPGVMERLGLGFDDLKGLRKGLVYCSISAFGAGSPWAKRPANDIIVQGVSGLMDITGEPDGEPVRIGVPIVDFSSGLFALSGVLAALLVRGQYPEGQRVDVNMFDSSVAMMSNFVPSVLDLGRQVPRLGRGHPQIVPYQSFVCADGRSIMIGAFTQGFWRRLCVALDREEWVTDERFETNTVRVANRGVLVPLLEELMLANDRDVWCEVLGQHDVPFTPINSVAEALASELAVGSSTTLTDAAGETAHVSANPIRVPQWREMDHRMPPHLGDDTSEVFRGLLGMSQEEIEELSASGVSGIASPE
jgi:crotonobetainyl-CoA:carnitine CoA-transferase CaiB-like acyl-CoA transferase